jgi:hypothetical protein
MTLHSNADNAGVIVNPKGEMKGTAIMNSVLVILILNCPSTNNIILVVMIIKIIVIIITIIIIITKILITIQL